MIEVGILILILSVTTFATPINQQRANGPPVWLSESATVEQGAFTILLCAGHLQSPFDSIMVDHVYEQKTTPIYTKSGINPKLTERILAKRQEISDFSSLAIAIAALREEDSGEYVCYSSSAPLLRHSITLKIPTPINIMSFRNLGSFLFLRTPLQLRKGQKSGIECSSTIYGSRKAPRMKIKTDLGVDITQYFKYKSSVQESKNEAGFPVLTSMGYLTYETTNPDPSFHNRRLQCFAELEDKAAIASLLYVESEPSIMCDHYSQKALQGDDVVFRCVVTSQPSSYVSWSPAWLPRRQRDCAGSEKKRDGDDDDAEKSLKRIFDADSEDGIINKISFESKVIDDNRTVHELRIPNARAAQCSEYVINATNDISSTTVTLKIDKD